jgi:outer membrane lipopolysaccharide assembly protein LptE/RlpB
MGVIRSFMPNTRQLQYLALLVIVTALLPSCGYRLSGTGGLVPAGAGSIAIPVLLNGTSEPYVDVEVTRAVVNEFLSDGRLRVVDVQEADLALRGTITRYEVSALSYTADALVQQYQVRLVVDAALEDLNAKKVIWQEKNIESLFISDYPVAYDPSGKLVNIRETKIAKETAIRKASQDIAWTLRSRVLEGF